MSRPPHLRRPTPPGMAAVRLRRFGPVRPGGAPAGVPFVAFVPPADGSGDASTGAVEEASGATGEGASPPLPPPAPGPRAGDRRALPRVGRNARGR